MPLNQKSAKIFIVYSNLDIGGIPAKIIDIVNELTRVAPQTSITILLHKGSDNDLRSLITNPQAAVADFPYPKLPGHQLLFVLWLTGNIIRHKPDSVMAFISPYALPVIAIKKLLFFHQFRTVVSEDHYTRTMVNRMAYPLIQRQGIRILYPITNSVIAPTHAVSKQLEKISPGLIGRITVIPNWTRYAGIKFPINNRRQYDIAHLGRLVKSKCPMEVVAIMHQLIKTSQREIKCVIAGEGEEKDAIKSYIDSHGLQKNIDLLPAQQDVSRILLKSKTFLFLPEPQTEGFPMILLDAMACGAIVVTTPFNGDGEILKNQKNCYIASNRAEVISRLKMIISKSNTRLINEAKYIVSKNNSLGNTKIYIDNLII